MKTKFVAALFVALIFSLASCMNWTHEDAKRLWVDQINMNFAPTENIDGYFDRRSGVILQSSQEVRPGVMEYAFEEKAKWFTPAEEKCRFIIVVNKDTRRIIDWRYNGNPDYCTSNP